jgi:RNA polymerase sigma-70 factor (ECF subfamily)
LDTLDVVRRAYERHKKRLLTMAVALTGDHGAGEDIVHDVFAGLLHSRACPCSRSSLGRYLVVCARNRAIDWLRARKRHRIDSSDPSELSSGADDSAAVAVRKEEANAALEAVGALPQDLREVLVLRIWGGLSFRHIARLQGIGKSAAHERYNRALAEVQKQLTGRIPR